jgi:Phosphotransferase enzyme family
VPLEDLLEQRTPWPQPPLSVAVSLGRLLAALVRTDVRHDDLHAGNVMIDPEGRAHLIDLAHVRVGRAVDAASLLIGCSAGLRERDPDGFRARALAAFRRNARSAWGDLTPEVIEAGARVRRREVVLRRVARYWRESGALREIQIDGVRGLLARDVPARDLPALDSDAPPPGHVAVRAKAQASLAERWERAARCSMHRLLAERPVALIHAPSPRAVLAAPALRPIKGDLKPSPAALGRALGALHDRGLALKAPGNSALALADDGRVWIAGGKLVPSQGLAGPDDARAWLTRLKLDPCRELVQAFLGAQRGTARELSDLARAWNGRG